MRKEILKNIASYIDHTNLKPDAPFDTIRDLCMQAGEYNFASVCILPHYVPYARNVLADKDVRICTVVGFPLGATYLRVKSEEMNAAIEFGAKEIDMVINLPAMITGDYNIVADEVETLAEWALLKDCTLKVIIETSLLNEEQKIKACEIVTKANAGFIKTSTGFSGGGATTEDVMLMRKYCGKHVQVKASGGIRNAEFALELIEAGADRIGTSSGIKIVSQAGEMLEKL